MYDIDSGDKGPRYEGVICVTPKGRIVMREGGDFITIINRLCVYNWLINDLQSISK